MPTPWDHFIEEVEHRKKQLDDVLEAYQEFRRKLQDLPPDLAEKAQRALLSVVSNPDSPVGPQTSDFIGRTALDCAVIIMRERKNEAIHYSEIAKEAMRRGYRGRSHGSEAAIESRVVQSFWATLHRSERFESVGKGIYRLS